ncbi:MAG: hypothetical protein QXH30_02840 [Candidatus Bilamarchaeaceae archaeon]
MKGKKTRARNTALLRLYTIRLRLAAILNILEVINVVSSMMDVSELRHRKLKRRANLTGLLYALTVRCIRLIDEMSLHAGAIENRGWLPASKCPGMLETLSAKKRELGQAQAFLEQRSLCDALKKLSSANVGLDALARQMDEELEAKLR